MSRTKKTRVFRLSVESPWFQFLDNPYFIFAADAAANMDGRIGAGFTFTAEISIIVFRRRLLWTQAPFRAHGGKSYAKAKMEPEHDLHLRAAAGEPAAHLPLRHDHGDRSHGLRKDHGGELVSGRTHQGGDGTYHPDQRVFQQPCDLLEKRTGGVCPCGLSLPAGVSLPYRRRGAADCWRTTSAMSWPVRPPATSSLTISTCSQTNASHCSSAHWQTGCPRTYI